MCFHWIYHHSNQNYKIFNDILPKLQEGVLQSFGTKCVHCLCTIIQLYAGEVSMHCCTSRSWLYNILPSGLVVLQHNRVVRMPNTFTDEHPDMRFICCFCNGNGRAAVGEYQSQYPVHKTSENISTYTEFQGTIVPSNQPMQIINTRDKSIFWH